jgi:2-polyprenyl-3-methyl-5-hydroxy-6-metoxy-1,4-benzoquinol methylase
MIRAFKKLLKKILFSKSFAQKILPTLLKLHSKMYALSGQFASIANDGVHPKHQIMKYKEWFLDNITSDSVVLDVGCNTGMMPEVMSAKAQFVYGIEIVQSHIDEAKAKRQKDNIEFICADATRYNYSKCQAIDVVTLSNVLEHIEERVEFLQKLIQQIKWRDKKRFLIRVPMIDREWIAVYKKELGLEYRLDRTHFIEYTYGIFKDELEQAGIKIISYHVKFGEIYAICEAIK